MSGEFLCRDDFCLKEINKKKKMKKNKRVEVLGEKDVEMKKGNLGNIIISSSSGLIDAKLEQHQLCGSKQCPGCGHKLQGKPDWLGLPAGVKFDPTDQELIEHLEAKVEAKDMIKSHPLIDEFIPTIEGEDGICYTHPEKLPGVTKDGLSRHFFHRPSKAYTTGTRKRRKIQTEIDDVQGGGETRWHKTGKTRPVMANGKQKGCKKILVLYTNFGKNRKPEKTNWVMHQYHLGQHEEEKDGELVVSKIFYQTQPRHCNWTDRTSAAGTSSSSSSKQVINVPHTDHQHHHHMSSSSPPSGIVAPISTYGAVDIHHTFKPDLHFTFAPLRKNFDEVGNVGEGQGSDRPHHEQVQQHVHSQNISSTTFHNITRPCHPISTLISPPLHHTSMVLNDDPFHVSRLMLQNDSFQHQQQQQQQHHQKLGSGRSASGLEELIMACTSTDIKEQESSMASQQEAEWLKYSTFWHDPDNQDHHG